MRIVVHGDEDSISKDEERGGGHDDDHQEKLQDGQQEATDPGDDVEDAKFYCCHRNKLSSAFKPKMMAAPAAAPIRQMIG
jgi:hypothetical protein